MLGKDMRVSTSGSDATLVCAYATGRNQGGGNHGQGAAAGGGAPQQQRHVVLDHRPPHAAISNNQLEHMFSRPRSAPPDNAEQRAGAAHFAVCLIVPRLLWTVHSPLHP